MINESKVVSRYLTSDRRLDWTQMLGIITGDRMQGLTNRLAPLESCHEGSQPMHRVAA